MGCDVYANGDEIACKAGMGNVIAAFPDVCLTPPPPPAGPIPVPYPNTSFSKDTQNGSKTVEIKGQEVMLKDSSFYKSAPLGDEPATQAQGAGVITHVITGKTYFTAWSMDVMFEGKNVDRHTDITTSNHASPMANNNVPMTNIGMPATPEPPSQECVDAVGEMDRVLNGNNDFKSIKKRTEELRANPQNQPMFWHDAHPGVPRPPGSDQWGHLIQIEQQQTQLVNAQQSYYDNECTNAPHGSLQEAAHWSTVDPISLL
jgi:hypothetical protein